MHKPPRPELWGCRRPWRRLGLGAGGPRRATTAPLKVTMRRFQTCICDGRLGLAGGTGESSKSREEGTNEAGTRGGYRWLLGSALPLLCRQRVCQGAVEAT